MDRKELKRLLTEGNFSSPGVSANVGLPAMWSGRKERLGQVWQDLVVDLEALFLDVLETEEQVYMAALPHLRDIRASNPEACHENLPRFRALQDILVRASKSAQQSQSFALFAERMGELVRELEWACEQIAPNDNRPPELPVQDKDEWEREKYPTDSKADVRFESQGWDSRLRQTLKEPRQEKALHPSCPSLVMASLRRAADSVSESSRIESSFLAAGDAIRLCLEAYTDVASVRVEVGMDAPGNPPRLDVVAEWADKQGPTPVVGKCSLLWVSGSKVTGLYVEGKLDDMIQMSEQSTDEQIARRIYDCLDEAIDVGPTRTWKSEARIVPTLYRYAEKAFRGEYVPDYTYSQVLDTLRPALGLHEAVGLVADDIRMVAESLGANVLIYYDWEMRYQEPFPHGDEDEKPADGGLKEAYAQQWRSPGILIDIAEGKVWMVNQDGKAEELDKQMTDEDIAARLATMSWQKESYSGKVVESWEYQFLGEVEATAEAPPVARGSTDDWDPTEHPRDDEGQFATKASPGTKVPQAPPKRDPKAGLDKVPPEFMAKHQQITQPPPPPPAQTPPKEPTVRRDNPDLDSIFGIAPPQTEPVKAPEIPQSGAAARQAKPSSIAQQVAKVKAQKAAGAVEIPGTGKVGQVGTAQPKDAPQGKPAAQKTAIDDFSDEDDDDEWMAKRMGYTPDPKTVPQGPNADLAKAHAKKFGYDAALAAKYMDRAAKRLKDPTPEAVVKHAEKYFKTDQTRKARAKVMRDMADTLGLGPDSKEQAQRLFWKAHDYIKSRYKGKGYSQDELEDKVQSKAAEMAAEEHARKVSRKGLVDDLADTLAGGETMGDKPAYYVRWVKARAEEYRNQAAEIVARSRPELEDGEEKDAAIAEVARKLLKQDEDRKSHMKDYVRDLYQTMKDVVTDITAGETGSPEIITRMDSTISPPANLEETRWDESFWETLGRKGI